MNSRGEDEGGVSKNGVEAFVCVAQKCFSTNWRGGGPMGPKIHENAKKTTRGGEGRKGQVRTEKERERERARSSKGGRRERNSVERTQQMW